MRTWRGGERLGKLSPSVPITQWIEFRPSKSAMEVRFLLGTLLFSAVEKAQGLPKKFGESLEFDIVNPTLVGLDLGAEVRSAPKGLRDIALSHSRLDSSGLELARKGSMLGRMKSTSVFWHRLSLLDKEAYFCKLFAPKIGAEVIRHET